MKTALLSGLLGFAAVHAGAAALFSVGPERAVLIELYTSEGCSSCPPADEWLNELKSKPGLWKDFVPVEFHVNYWDDLGWKDRLATQALTAREYAYASSWGCQPYTPCFARNGAQWKPGWGAAAGSGAPAGLLSLKVRDDGECEVAFTPGPAARPPEDGGYEIHVAVLGGGISSAVTAGENSGRTLQHEFVVLGLTNHVLSQPDGSDWSGTVALPRPTAAGVVRHAVAAWVTLRGELEPIQAVGGWLN